ncbi:MAG: SusE domain-containing protein [Bacteroidales bacterium]
MKYLKYTMLMLVAVFTFASCEIDVDKTQLASDDQLVAPVIDPMQSVIIDQNTSAVEDITFTWDNADFGAPIQIQYNIMAKLGDNEALVGQSFTNSLTISKEDFNGIIVNQLGVKANEDADINVYVAASIYDIESDTLKSNLITFNVSTFKAQLKTFYMTGAYDGWDGDGSPNEFWETSGGTNVYDNLIDIGIASDNGDYPISYFKLLSAVGWSNDLGFDAITPSWTLPDPEQSDSNFSVDITDGSIAKISVDMNAKTISCKMYSMIGIMGSFNGWASDLVFKYDLANNYWTTDVVTFAEDGEFKIRMDGKWDETYGGPLVASDEIDGGFEISGGDNMKIPSAGDYTFTLYTNRTPWVLVMNKQ